MPLDSSFNYDGFKRRCIGWERKVSLLPRRCYYTKKSIWLKNAYFGTSMLTGPGEPLFEHRWVHPKEYVFLKLKGTI